MSCATTVMGTSAPGSLSGLAKPENLADCNENLSATGAARSAAPGSSDILAARPRRDSVPAAARGEDERAGLDAVSKAARDALRRAARRPLDTLLAAGYAVNQFTTLRNVTRHHRCPARSPSEEDHGLAQDDRSHEPLSASAHLAARRGHQPRLLPPARQARRPDGRPGAPRLHVDRLLGQPHARLRGRQVHREHRRLSRRPHPPGRGARRRRQARTIRHRPLRRPPSQARHRRGLRQRPRQGRRDGSKAVAASPPPSWNRPCATSACRSPW